MVKDLIHGDVEDKMEIAQALYDEGLLATMLVENPDRSVQTGWVFDTYAPQQYHDKWKHPMNIATC